MLIGVVDVIKVGQQMIERTYESVLIPGALFLVFLFRLLPVIDRFARDGAALDASMSALIDPKNYLVGLPGRNKKAIFLCAVGRIFFSRKPSKDEQLLARLWPNHHKEERNG